MIKRLLFLVWAAISLCAWPAQATLSVITSNKLSSFDKAQLVHEQQFISVKGNAFVDERGETFIFQGMNIADPIKLVRESQWKKALFIELKEWGVNVIRLPIHPKNWREVGPETYLQILDQAVVWANQLGLYLIIDWHSIGYLPSEIFQRDIYVTSLDESKRFWHLISQRYKGIATTALYEIFNEPTDLNGKAGKANWAEWKAMNETFIDIIYANDPRVIPLVAGFNWAYDLTPIANDPIEREGIGYVTHPYPQKAKPASMSTQQFFEKWEESWGFAAKDYPLIATELGWVRSDGKGAHVPVIDDEGVYGPRIMQFMRERGISWTGWVFDPQWSPTMIENWSYTPTEQGVFFKETLTDKQ